eukprot:15810586-Heterocapsa_arctica.AAC.1
MAVSGSNDDEDDSEVYDFDSKVDDFPPGAPGAAEEEEAPDSYLLGSRVRFVGDVRGSGGAD